MFKVRDLPARSGILGALHLRLGYFAIMLVNLTRPRLSLGVRLVAFDGAGRVYLVRHSYVPGFHLPGGGVDPDESCAQAVAREAREEGGLLLAGEPRLFHVYWNTNGGRRDHVVLFVAQDVVEDGPRPRSLEILEAGFYPLDALPENVTPATRDRIAEVMEERRPSDRW